MPVSDTIIPCDPTVLIVQRACWQESKYVQALRRENAELRTAKARVIVRARLPVVLCGCTVMYADTIVCRACWQELERALVTANALSILSTGENAQVVARARVEGVNHSDDRWFKWHTFKHQKLKHQVRYLKMERDFLLRGFRAMEHEIACYKNDANHEIKYKRSFSPQPPSTTQAW